ncbi:hypothetical protein FPQ18DRAFT_65110 [Pyronema domesticum]|nr:hypothetical protein FPQ18DRAFT_65110 [Pyronema domesticum]
MEAEGSWKLLPLTWPFWFLFGDPAPIPYCHRYDLQMISQLTLVSVAICFGDMADDEHALPLLPRISLNNLLSLAIVPELHKISLSNARNEICRAKAPVLSGVMAAWRKTGQPAIQHIQF